MGGKPVAFRNWLMKCVGESAASRARTSIVKGCSGCVRTSSTTFATRSEQPTYVRRVFRQRVEQHDHVEERLAHLDRRQGRSRRVAQLEEPREQLADARRESDARHYARAQSLKILKGRRNALRSHEVVFSHSLKNGFANLYSV